MEIVEWKIIKSKIKYLLDELSNRLEMTEGENQ